MQIAAMMAHPEINFDELEKQIQFDGEEAADDCQEWRAAGKQARDEFGLSASYGNDFGSDGTVAGARQGTAYISGINEVRSLLCVCVVICGYDNYQKGLWNHPDQYTPAHVLACTTRVVLQRELPQLEQLTTADVHHDMYGIDMDVDTANSSEQREGEFRMPPILEPCRTVLYVTAEETREQVGGPGGDVTDLFRWRLRYLGCCGS